MEGPHAGRPLAQLDPGASRAAQLGAELRAWRQAQGLTLKALGRLTGYSIQHISEVERAKTTMSRRFVAACDRALEAQGALLALLPVVVCERALVLHDRAAARRYSEDDVEPCNRRGLLEAGATTALAATALGPVPAAASEVDPALPEHWASLLMVLGRHAETFGPHAVLAIARRELCLIAAHRGAARGALRTALMRAEARWAAFAAWLCHHAGNVRDRDAWTDRALQLAHESDYADMGAFVRGRQSKFADNPRRAVECAEAALRTRGASPQTRAWCARYAAIGHARAGDAAFCERSVHDAYVLLEDADSPAPPWAHPFRVTRSGTRAAEARCWLVMAPVKAISFYEDALRDWPRAEIQHGGIAQARLALACALAGERDRARAEGASALAVYKQTRSATAARELRLLGTALRAV